jgi:hypothetical protein
VIHAAARAPTTARALDTLYAAGLTPAEAGVGGPLGAHLAAAMAQTIAFALADLARVGPRAYAAAVAHAESDAIEAAGAVSAATGVVGAKMGGKGGAAGTDAGAGAGASTSEAGFGVGGSNNRNNGGGGDDGGDGGDAFGAGGGPESSGGGGGGSSGGGGGSGAVAGLRGRAWRLGARAEAFLLKLTLQHPESAGGARAPLLAPPVPEALAERPNLLREALLQTRIARGLPRAAATGTGAAVWGDAAAAAPLPPPPPAAPVTALDAWPAGGDPAGGPARRGVVGLPATAADEHRLARLLAAEYELEAFATQTHSQRAPRAMRPLVRRRIVFLSQ